MSVVFAFILSDNVRVTFYYLRKSVGTPPYIYKYILYILFRVLYMYMYYLDHNVREE